MKNLFTFLCMLTILSVGSLTANDCPVGFATNQPTADDTEISALVADLRGAVTPSEIESAVTALEAVSSKGSGNWLVHYHTAYGFARLAHNCADTDEIDGWVDKGEAALQRAKTAGGASKSELLVVEAYLNYARIRVSPFLRGYQYSNAGIKLLNAAYEADKENPRVCLLFAQHFINVPAILGGDTEKACNYNNAAQNRFQREAKVTDRNPLAPSWGRGESDDITNLHCPGSKK